LLYTKFLPGEIKEEANNIQNDFNWHRNTNKMKTIIFTSISLFLIMVCFTSCSKKVFFQQSTVVPAAEGYVTITKDKSENYIIKMEVRNLAEVERLEPSNRNYVVWMITESEAPVNIGRISTSNALKVSFETLSSFRPVKIFITAEAQEDARYPSSMVILSTNRF
jgi:anti-sigma-K factor RskA